MRAIITVIAVMMVAGLADAAPNDPPLLRVAPFSDHDALSEMASGNGQRPSIQVALPQEVAGVTINRVEDRASFPRFVVEGIRPGDQILCVTLTSIDGYYTGKGRVQVNESARKSGSATLLVPSTVRRFATLQTGDLAIEVHAVGPRQSCDAKTDLLATYWIGKRPGDQLTVLVAGGGTAKRPEIRRTSEDIASPCDTIPDRGGMQSAFRFACTPKAGACRPSESFEIDWLQGSSRIRGFTFTIRRTCRSGS